MPNCVNCGGANRPGTLYCVKCGAAIEDPNAGRSAPQQQQQYPESGSNDPGHVPSYMPEQMNQVPGDKGWAGTASLILGIISIPSGGCCCFVGLLPAILGIVFGIMGLNSSQDKLAKIGIALSIAGLIFMCIISILQFVFHVVVPGAMRVH